MKKAFIIHLDIIKIKCKFQWGSKKKLLTCEDLSQSSVCRYVIFTIALKGTLLKNTIHDFLKVV